MRARSKTMKLDIPSKLSEGVDVVEKIVEKVSAQGFSEAGCFAIRLSLDEALANAIRHGNSNDAAKSVAIEYSIADDLFQVTICDKGPGFEPDKVPDPTLDENLERPCGRGVMLMRAYMTEVTFNESGNCVTMLKRKDCMRPRLAPG